MTEETSVDSAVIHWADIGWSVVLETSWNMAFKAYEIITWDINDATRPTGWPRPGATDSAETVADLSEAASAVEGEIRWDGCSHWTVQAEGYLHLCGADGIEHFAELILRIKREAAVRVPGFDG